MPSSISDVIRLMESYNPTANTTNDNRIVEENVPRFVVNYESKYVNANKDKLGVSHWIQTNKWKPPDEEALSALMVIIRDMIDKAWPL